MGVGRLAMYQDNNYIHKENIIKEIRANNIFKPNDNKRELLLMRYNNWKNLYTSNKKISQKLMI